MPEKVVIGNAELWHGDCREVLPLLPRFAAVVTDPPYGLADLLHRPGSGQWEKHYREGAPTWDRETVADGVTAALAQADKAVVWGGQFYLLQPSRCWLSWNKILRNWSSSEAFLFRDRETKKRWSLRDLGDGPVRRNEALPSCSFFCEIAEQEYGA